MNRIIAVRNKYAMAQRSPSVDPHTAISAAPFTHPSRAAARGRGIDCGFRKGVMERAHHLTRDACLNYALTQHLELGDTGGWGQHKEEA